MDGGAIVVTVLSGLVAVLGSVSNTLSLSYFTRKSKLNTRKEGTLTRRLFIYLNISDVVVCVSVFGCSFRDLVPYVNVGIVCTTICIVSSLSTGFLTCVLAVTRTFSLVWPLHIVRFRPITAGMIVYGLIVLVMVPVYIIGEFGIVSGWDGEFTLVTFSRIVMFVILFGIFFVVLVSNVISMVKIHRSQSIKRESEKRRATITVGILSVFYCVFNIGFLIDLGFDIVSSSDSQKHLPELLSLANFHVLIILNSACNPIVYFVRKAEMRIYLKDTWRKVVCGRNHGGEVVVDLSAINTLTVTHYSEQDLSRPD